MSQTRSVPVVLVSAPASGQGKTSVTAALARWHRGQGRRVRVFKTGADFLDPLVLERASGAPVYQLDAWMGGEADIAARLYQAAAEADLILIEGVMGLYDGSPSTADLAQQFGLPVLAVIDADAMAQTFGAVALGLMRYRTDVAVVGVAANRIGGDYHLHLLRDSVPPELAWFGALPNDPAFHLPERHLGLLPAAELPDLDARLDSLADAWAAQGHAAMPAPVALAPAVLPEVPRALARRRIAIARDAAFAFLYPANLDLLREAGAQLRFFSPLAGEALPVCDAVWLPGGYPELHLAALAARTDLHAALHVHVNAGKPLLAECGGLLFVLDALAGGGGQSAPMAGLLRGRATIQPRETALGLQTVTLPEGTLRGHTYHHAQAQIDAVPIGQAVDPHGGPHGEALYRRQRFTASFVHLYFPSNPAAAVALFGA